jgi:excisionase family DNA binding protein
MKLHLKQAAPVIGVSPFMLGCLVRGRRIPHYRIGRRIVFDQQELERWLAARHVPDESPATAGNND